MTTSWTDQALTRFLRTTAGAPLSCLFALMALKRPIGVMALCDFMGKSYPTVSHGLRTLELLGYAAQLGRTESWQLTSQGQQIPLPGILISRQSEPAGQALTSGAANQVQGDEIEEGDSTLHSQLKNFQLASVVVDPDPNFDQIESTTTNNSAASSKKFNSPKAGALRAAGIYGKKKTALLADDWVTPERIEGWQTEAERLAADGYEFTNRTGFVIQQLEEHEDPPEVKETPAPKSSEWQRLQDLKAFYRSLPADDRRIRDLSPISRMLYLEDSE